VRRLSVVAALVASACASMGSPPGGPQRDVPPALEGTSPDSGAVNVRADRVTFDFDVVVSDRPAGHPTLEDAFLISPSEGKPRVSWERDRIEVRPRRGFRPNTAYAVTMLPGITDLTGNVMTEGRTIVFSTGATIPQFTVRGRVFDWMNDRVAPKAFVEVVRRPDSLPYIGAADSSGQFTVGPLAAATYSVRAYMDNNGNRALDPGEPWDTLNVIVRDASPFVELLAAPRDTIAPRLLTVTPQDSLTLLLNLDRPVDPALAFTPAQFRVVGADSVPLRIATARRRPSREQAADSLPRDTTAQADTITRRPADAGAQEPRPSMPTPIRDVILTLDSLTPMRAGGSYRVSASGMRGLLGAHRPSERVVTFERARGDTAAARPRP
jgi:hypothetical protein